MPRHQLRDGTDISRMTTEQIKHKTDQSFFADARKLSPRFPTLDEAAERRRAFLETVVARTFLAFTFVGPVLSGFEVRGDWKFGAAFSAISFIGFVATCFVAGNRQYRKIGNEGRHGRRPF